MGFGAALQGFFSSHRKEAEIQFSSGGAVNEITIVNPFRSSVKASKAAWVAASLSVLLAASIVLAGVAYRVHRDVPTEFREVYLTDAPADLDKLWLRLDRVLIGEEQNPLPLVRERLDILQYRGVDRGVLIAAGRVPTSEDPTVRIVLKEAEACGDWGCLTLHMKNNVIRVEAETAPSMLVDLDVEASVEVDSGPGGDTLPVLSFEPKVKAVYARLPEQAHATWAPSEYESTAVPASEDLVEDARRKLAGAASSGDASDPGATVSLPAGSYDPGSPDSNATTLPSTGVPVSGGDGAPPASLDDAAAPTQDVPLYGPPAPTTLIPTPPTSGTASPLPPATPMPSGTSAAPLSTSGAAPPTSAAPISTASPFPSVPAPSTSALPVSTSSPLPLPTATTSLPLSTSPAPVPTTSPLATIGLTASVKIGL